VLKQSDMKLLASSTDFRDVDYIQVVRELVPESLTCPRGYLTSRGFPHLKSLLYLGPEKYRGMYNIPELLLLGEHASDEDYARAREGIGCHDVINMQYTSGTTGFPKGVMLTSYNISTTAGSSASARSSRTPIACACPCRCFTASDLFWACWPFLPTAPPR